MRYEETRKVTPEDIQKARDYDEQWAVWFHDWYKMTDAEKDEYKALYLEEFPNIMNKTTHDRIHMRKVFDKYFWKPLKVSPPPYQPTGGWY